MKEKVKPTKDLTEPVCENMKILLECIELNDMKPVETLIAIMIICVHFCEELKMPEELCIANFKHIFKQYTSRVGENE